MQRPVILSIDNDLHFNKILSVQLKALDFTSITTTDPIDFTARLKELSPAVCIIDLNLGDIGGEGFPLIKAIRNKLGNSIPILVLSKLSDHKSIIMALEAGATDYLSKPIDPLMLEIKIKEFTQEESTTTLPLYQVPKKESQSTVSIPVSIHEISEYGITFKSSNFYSKGTYVYLNSDLLKSLNLDVPTVEGTINRNWIDEEGTGFFLYFVEFNFADEDLMSIIRKYLRNKS